MYIIKLNATESTNVYLKELFAEVALNDFTVVVANEQSKGRGQMGTVWESEPGKNLTFSVLKRFDDFMVSQQFMINVMVSMALYKHLKKLQIPDLSVKWPNDILSGHHKIAGILIENILSGDKIQSSVIGIGLNVNQMHFNNLPNVSSIKLILGKNMDLDELLSSILKSMQETFAVLNAKDPSIVNTILENYKSVLFRKDKPSTFRNENDELFMGFITDVSAEGKIIVTLEDDVKKEFGLKEIKLLY
ncbi:biotin--[acetyl-CoA-carboxylase] ligase [Sediminicola arcticus]|jgi:BirA family biotin operon repressor/biotin-[acetyl-CoA-carboxylase] ligase|uniref:Biotin--[acetyl-CoA-carboxylase] ligase n=1 Tax=Sediminicola arcticus TaxID=1574308 RepID=A0ABV2SYT5_9FLAO